MNRPSNKQLFVWGSNDNGCLGLGDEAVGKVVVDPTELSAPHGTMWIQVASGDNHIAAVSSNGDLFTWGDGGFGQLGHGDHKDRYTPTKVEIPGGEAVVKVACGLLHTAAVTATGKLFTWYVRSCYLY